MVPVPWAIAPGAPATRGAGAVYKLVLQRELFRLENEDDLRALPTAGSDVLTMAAVLDPEAEAPIPAAPAGGGETPAGGGETPAGAADAVLS